MRYITIPAAIVVSDPSGATAAIDFEQFFLRNTWTADKAYGENVDAILEAMDVRRLFAGKAAGAVVELTDGVHARLAAVVSAPTGGYTNPGIIMQLMPMLDAILKAPNADPRIAAP